MNPVQGTNSSKLEAPEQNPSEGITVLPHELFDKIFKNLPLKNQRLMGGTCKTFREIYKTTFSEQKEQVVSFLKRILGTKFTPGIEKLIVDSKDFKAIGKVIEDRIWTIKCDVVELSTLLLPQAIYTHTQLEDLSTIELLHDLLEVSPILYLPSDFYSKIPQGTVDRLADMLIEKHGLHHTYKMLKKTPGLGLMPHSREIIQYANKKNDQYIYRASDRLKNNKDFVLDAVRHGCTLDFAPARLKDDKDVVLAAVKKDSDNLEFASDRLKDDQDVVLAAVRNGRSLHFASDRLKDDKDVVLAAVQKHGDNLEFASDRLKDDQDVVLAAVQKHGCSLEFASDRLKNDRDVVLAALETTLLINIIKDYIPPELKEDPEVQLWLSWNRLDTVPTEIWNSPRFKAMMKRIQNR
jgi:hypothetical protein